MIDIWTFFLYLNQVFLIVANLYLGFRMTRTSPVGFFTAGLISGLLMAQILHRFI